ncbi:MAG: glycosyltransferase family 39 protein [Chloroflexota bacterium]
MPLHPSGIIIALALPALIYGVGRWIPHRAALTAALVLIALTILKLGIAAAAPEYGLKASYFDNSRFNGRPERSSEFRLPDATRLDRAIDFGGDEFPVYFFNDSERFNYFGSGQPQRRQLPFSVLWTGVLLVPEDGRYTFRLTASGEGSVDFGTVLKLAINADGRDSREYETDLRAGELPVRAEYSRRPARSPDFHIDWLRDGRFVPLADPYLRPEAGGTSLQQDGVLRVAASGLNGLAALVGLTVLTATLWNGMRLSVSESGLGAQLRHWERSVVSLVALGFVLLGSIPRMDRVGKMVYLGGGQDWLLHETLARDILIHGPLMTLGKDLGEGRAFYAQPFYPYMLAALHWLFGEDQFGPIAAQVAMLGFTCVIIWELGNRLYGRGVAWTSLLLATIFSGVQLDWVARRLLSESLYFLVLPAALLACVIAHQRGSLRAAVSSGVLIGICVLTRGTTLLLLPFAGALLWRRRGLQLSLLLVTVAALVVSLAPLRNAIVSGRPSLLATSGGVNMEKFHRPSDSVRLARVDDHPIYNGLGLDRPTREVLEFIQQDPLGYLQACLTLAAYTIGLGFALEEAQVPLYPDLISYTAIYILTLGLQARARIPEAWYLHAFIAIHFAAMVIFTPYDYENRLVLPMFLPMLCFVGLGLLSAGTWLTRVVRSRPDRATVTAPIQANVSNGRP